jgi:septum site-determining protein MinC
MQIRFKGENGRLLLLLPPEVEAAELNAATWQDLRQQIKQRLNSGDRFWQSNTPVHLIARDRLLDGRQLQDVEEVLSEAGLQLKRIYTSRRQTAVAAATSGYSVEQHSTLSHLNQPEATGQAIADPLYIQTTVRSGVEVRHQGTIVVLGDVNAGSSLIADGDVVVWGTLRGMAQAGAAGNSQCLVMALRMEPTQIRIANAWARAPENPHEDYAPEVAFISGDAIKIVRAIDFAKERVFMESSGLER